MWQYVNRTKLVVFSLGRQVKEIKRLSDFSKMNRLNHHGIGKLFLLKGFLNWVSSQQQQQTYQTRINLGNSIQEFIEQLANFENIFKLTLAMLHFAESLRADMRCARGAFEKAPLLVFDTIGTYNWRY